MAHHGAARRVHVGRAAQVDGRRRGRQRRHLRPRPARGGRCGRRPSRDRQLHQGAHRSTRGRRVAARAVRAVLARGATGRSAVGRRARPGVRARRAGRWSNPARPSRDHLADRAPIQRRALPDHDERGRDATRASPAVVKRRRSTANTSYFADRAVHPREAADVNARTGNVGA